MEFVSWDDDIPNIWKIIKFMFQTTNQIIVHVPFFPNMLGGSTTNQIRWMMCFATRLIPGAYAELQDNRDHFAALVVKGLGNSPVFEVWKDNSEKMALRPDKTLEHLQTNISMYRNICLFDIFCDFVFAKK